MERTEAYEEVKAALEWAQCRIDGVTPDKNTQTEAEISEANARWAEVNAQALANLPALKPPAEQSKQPHELTLSEIALKVLKIRNRITNQAHQPNAYEINQIGKSLDEVLATLQTTALFFETKTKREATQQPAQGAEVERVLARAEELQRLQDACYGDADPESDRDDWGYTYSINENGEKCNFELGVTGAVEEYDFLVALANKAVPLIQDLLKLVSLPMPKT